MDVRSGTGIQLESVNASSSGIVEQSLEWRFLTRIAFRFAFSYLLLYNISTFIDLFPFTDTIAEKYEQVWQRLVPWIGSHVMHLAHPITIFSNGSGDTTYDYVKIIPQLAIAVVATLSWSLMDRRRTNYRALHQWFMLLMRSAIILRKPQFFLSPSSKTTLWRSKEPWMAGISISICIVFRSQRSC